MVRGLSASAGRFFSGAGFPVLGNPRLAQSAPAQDTARARLSASNGWQITDLYKNEEQEPSIIFSEEALEETTAQLLGPAYGPTRVEEPDDGQDADAVMQAAEAHMYQNPLQGLMPVLSSMLRDPEIQRATISHLQRNPDFHRYMLASSATPTAQLTLEWPESASQGEEAPGGLQGLIEDLASKIKAAGEAAMQKAAGFRIALGRLLIHLGANLHAFLGQPFSKAPLEENMSQEELDERADMIGQALTTVAVAILSIVFLKRAHLISAL